MEVAVLKPNWSQSRPSATEVQLACDRLKLVPVTLPTAPFDEFLSRLRESHTNGGAQIAGFDVPQDAIMDWFASRNRLSDEGLLDLLLAHATVRQSLPDIAVPDSGAATGLALADAFLLDGRFAHCLHFGGAYSSRTDDGKVAKRLALDVCDAMFGLRYGEISMYESHESWTPWFCGRAWDLTEVVFDRRLRRLWVFAITDTD